MTRTYVEVSAPCGKVGHLQPWHDTGAAVWQCQAAIRPPVGAGLDDPDHLPVPSRRRRPPTREQALPVDLRGRRGSRAGFFRYLLLYLTCGDIAAPTQAYLDPTDQVPMIGASGAIAGVLGAYFVLNPRGNVVVL